MLILQLLSFANLGHQEKIKCKIFPTCQPQKYEYYCIATYYAKESFKKQDIHFSGSHIKNIATNYCTYLYLRPTYIYNSVKSCVANLAS